MSARLSTGAAALVVGFVAAVAIGDAHKPITSPFTFNDDVFPIVRERCGACHVPDGVAPMSLMSYADAVPWGESIRSELIAGHMPPWPVESARDRFQNAAGLTARDLNVLLTWATGGTPPGDPAKTPPAITSKRQWPLGDTGTQTPLPAVTIDQVTQDKVVTLWISPPPGIRRMRAIDLLPGTPAVVRSAQIAVVGDAFGNRTIGPERLLALWLPGETPVALERGSAFDIPAGAMLAVQVRYKKTWQHEHDAMNDRSIIGFYPAADDATPIRVFEMRGSGQLDADLRALAIYPDPGLTGLRATVEIRRPDGSREELIALRAQPDWARRYWFKQPVLLPKGTTYSVRYTPLEDAKTSTPPESRRMFLDVAGE